MTSAAAAAYLRDRIWPARLYIWQLLRAAILAPGITVTVLAAVFSTALSLLLSDLVPRSLLASSSMRLLLVFSMLGLIVLTLSLSGAIALATADPKTYARILIAGRPAKEVLFVISRHIITSCERTLRVADRAEILAKILDENHTKGSAKEKERKWIESLLRRLRRLIRQLHVPLLRMEELKQVASDELGIPQRRLCDHLFQYSPAIHRDRLQKFLGRWEELKDLRRVDKAADKRFHELRDQNQWFTNNTRRRIRYQTQIVLNRDLHPYIVQLASIHSTSGALRTYTKTLTFLAAVGQRRLERARHSSSRERIQRDIRERLLFLHRKQRAHPGFDLHILLRQAICHIGPPGALRTVQQILDALGNAPEYEASPLLQHLSAEQLSSFHTLPAELARRIAADREKIANKFKEIYNHFSRHVRGSLYLVSHGYSRTVLSTIQGSLPWKDLEPAERPRIFFLLAEEPDSFDTRVMEYELKEDSDSRHFYNLAAGDEHHFLALVARGDAALIIMGAECFDAEGRVVHPRGIAQRLGDLVKLLRERGVASIVAVVAESYKRQEVPLTAIASFYCQHFDRIALYEHDPERIIVTEDSIYPREWQQVVERSGATTMTAGQTRP